MRWLCSAGVVFWLLGGTAATPLRADDSGPKLDFDPKVLDVFVEQAMQAMQVPGAAVAVVHHDKVIYLRGFGVRDRDSGQPVTPQTLFPIASCSKAFTATLIAMLVSQGQLKWDDRVREHWEEFRLADPLAEREVTIRDLLCHRTGMPRHDLLWSGLTREAETVLRSWCRARPSTSFRSSWEYSNVPYAIAGKIISKYEKADWAEVVAQRIFEPLQMRRSTARRQHALSDPDHVTPYYYTFDKRIVPVPWDEIEHVAAAGGISSCAADMAQWLRFQLNGGSYNGKYLLAAQQLRETHTPQMLFRPEGIWAFYFPPAFTRFTTYGLGWFVHDYRGLTCVSHGGTLSGIRTYCLLVPDARLGVCVLSNLRPSMFAEAVCRTVVDRLLGLPPVDWIKFGKDQLAQFDLQNALALQKREKARKPHTRPSLDWLDYCGVYEEPAYGKAEVVRDKGGLFVRWGRMTFRLDHYHYDTFTAVPVAPADEIVTFDRVILEARFHLNSEGTVGGMTFLGQDFTRQKDKK